MRFRNYEEHDFQELMALWDSLDMGGGERGDTAATINECNKRGGKLIILEDEEKGLIAGSSWMTFDGRRMFLHHFGIRKEYQRKGFGTMLAKESLKFIKDQGQQVKLEVHKENQVAKRLYEKAGFFAFCDYDIYMIRDTETIEL